MKLLIYNNTSRLSTVLNAFLEEAKDSFEKIYVVFPQKYNAEKDYGNYDGKVMFLTPNIKNMVVAGIISVWNLLQKRCISDYYLAQQAGKFGISFIKNYVRTNVVANILYDTSTKILHKSYDNLAIFSTWYEANAIAAAKAAKKYPGTFAASYAHSYEVDFRKNDFTVIIGDRFKEKYLNEIYFISKRVMDEYIDLNKAVLSYTGKYRAIHFGSQKKRDGLAANSNDGTFRIVSCSGISPVKRLDVLAEALAQYTGETKIEWTVLGDGPDIEKVKAITGKVDHTKVSVIFKGSVSNDAVHDYYVENKVDLFVNVSSSEGLPVSIMEAMSYGIPALATGVGGNHEIVTEKTGYPIPAEITPESLCAQINLITENIEECFKKRNAAFNMWNDNYRIDKNVAIVLERLKNGG